MKVDFNASDCKKCEYGRDGCECITLPIMIADEPARVLGYF